MTGLTFWRSENSGNPLGTYHDKIVLTGPGNSFKACLMMKSKFIKYINCSKAGSIMTVITMKGFLEKGACNDLINSEKHPFFRKPFTITGCNKCAVQ